MDRNSVIPFVRSSVVMYFDAPRFDIRLLIFGMGYGSLIVTLLSHLQSTHMQWVPSYFFMSWSIRVFIFPLALPGSGVLIGMGATLQGQHSLSESKVVCPSTFSRTSL